MKIAIPKNIRLGLKLATDIIPKLPARGDTFLQVAVKLLGIIDSSQNIMNPVTKGNPLDTIIERFDLEETKNEQFVSLFFDTNLYEQFDVHRFSLTDYLDVIDASHKSYGRLFFIEYTYSTSGPEASFYHSKSMDFPEILKGLWETYEGRLHVTIGPGEYGVGTKSEFASINDWPNPLYGTMQAQMDHLVARHRRFVLDKVPRSYMFYGAPGTGKSSFAIQFAEKLGERTLKMDAGSFAHAHVKDVTFLLNNLRPEFLLIDDVDKADVSKALPTLLEILQRFKSDHRSTSVLMTANTVSKFDAGLLRPERIDTWIEFPLPEAEERREILSRYAEKFEAHVTPEQMRELVEITDKLSQDYLREVAQLLRYDEVEHVVKTIALMQKLLQQAEQKSDEKGPKTDEPAHKNGPATPS